MLKRLFVVLLAAYGVSSVSAAQSVLVEAENFDRPGGWVNDSQFVDQMGSAFLLAHGLGHPVEDAVTTVKVSEPGTYRVWVRTRDWVAQWTKGRVEAPGRFQLFIDGTPLKTTFGTDNEKWHWQDGGTVEISKKTVELKLHDLTGFEGRCDAIFLTSDLKFNPPEDALAGWRRELLGFPQQPEVTGDYDLVVVGGGVAGVSAAISAGRLGLKVALIHNRQVTGGASSAESGVGLVGSVMYEPYPRVGSLVNEIAWNYGAKRFSFGNPSEAGDYQVQVLKEAGVDLYLNFYANEVFMEKGRIRGVGAVNVVNGRAIRVDGAWFVDATGDACIGVLAGADFDIGVFHMGRTNLWTVEDQKKPVAFPRCPWAIDLTDMPFPGRDTEEFPPIEHYSTFFGWFWESGFNHDPIEKGEWIRDNNFRAMYGAWDCIKNVDKKYPNHDIQFAYWISGKRESRRLFGDVILTAQDLKENKVFEDGVVPLSWPLDFHFPHPHFFDWSKEEGNFFDWPFVSHAPGADNRDFTFPYWLPYRTLYSRNIPNLFMAGRNISVTQEALGSVRVQATTGMMGEIVGMAASLCKKHGVDPRGVYESHMAELFKLMDQGTGRLPPPKLTAYEPFDFAGTLNGYGSGSGWRGDWQAVTGSGAKTSIVGLDYSATTELAAQGGRVSETSGGTSSERRFEEAVSLASGQFYISFLAQKDDNGYFRLELSNGRHIRLGLSVEADGTVTAQGATEKASSKPGVFEVGKPYFVVLKFQNKGKHRSAVASAKLFEVGRDTVPESARELEWDVMTAGGITGLEQDRVVLGISKGAVQFDELRMGDSWESVTTNIR